MSALSVPELLLVVAIYPLWVAAGLADWACHRASRIQATSGLRENLLHWLMFAQMGVAIVAVALLEVTAGLLLGVLAAFVLHEATVWFELRYTVPRREVAPGEQMVHSFMEILPLALLALLAVVGWEQVQALFGAGTADFALRPKADPWPPAVLWTGLAAAVACNALPLAEESLRCWRGRAALRLRTRERPGPT